MVTEMITVKLESSFLQDIDFIVQKGGYQNRTEFIRAALREKVEEANLKEAMMKIVYLKGSAKKKVTEEECEIAREKAFEEISKRFK